MHGVRGEEMRHPKVPSVHRWLSPLLMTPVGMRPSTAMATAVGRMGAAKAVPGAAIMAPISMRVQA